jgi:hypothetical protein
MTYHIWGDGFDFDGLSLAANWLRRLYKCQTGKDMIFKEKYGTIRYEMISFWITDQVEQQEFEECLKDVVTLFPQFAGELTDGFFNPYGELDGSDPSTQFFAGITFLHDALNKDTQDDVTE